MVMVEASHSIISADFTLRFYALREFDNAFGLVYVCAPARKGVGVVAATCGGQETWEDGADDRSQGWNASANDANIQLCC